MNEKHCTSCNKYYPATLEYFRRAALGKFGLSSECKECLKIRQKVYLKENPEKAHERNKQAKEYKKNNPSWLKNIKRRYYERHKDEVIAKSREYRKNNPGYSKISKEKNAQKHSARRALKAKVSGNFTKLDIEIQYKSQNGLCFYCNNLLCKYHVDHYVPLKRGGSNGPENIVLACPRCNTRKRDLMPNDFMEILRNENFGINV